MRVPGRWKKNAGRHQEIFQSPCVPETKRFPWESNINLALFSAHYL
jgi:hypothetical protein